MAGYGAGAWYPGVPGAQLRHEQDRSRLGLRLPSCSPRASSASCSAPGSPTGSPPLGYKDAYVRAILTTSLLTIVPSIAAPLAGSQTATLALLWPATLLNSAYLGVMAASFQPITPNQMRGQTTAIYIFVTSIIGMAAGASVLAAFTDFLYKDDGMLHYSIATANAIFYPAAALLFSFCLPAYRRSVEEAEAGDWQVD